MTDHSGLIAHLNRLGKLDLFLNPIPRPNPNELALSRIIPPPMPHCSRRRAILRLERMQRELEAGHFPIRIRPDGEINTSESRIEPSTSEVNHKEVAA